MCVTVIPWVLGIDGIGAGFSADSVERTGQIRSTEQGQNWGGSLVREAITKMCTLLPLLAGENVGSRFVVPTVAGLATGGSD